MYLTSRRFGVALLATAALVLTGCSQGTRTSTDSSKDESGTTTIRFMNFTSNGGHEGDLDVIVKAFEDENSSIDVELETLPYDDYFTALQTAVAGGTAADVFELNYENFVTYRENGSLAPMDGVDGSVFVPSLLEAFASDGTQYGLPESFSDVVLYYNKDLFAEAGVDTPTADWTWADEKSAAEKLTDGDVWGDYQPITYNEFYKALAQAGGDFFDADGKVAFDSPQGVAAAKWLVDKSGTTMPTAEDGAGTPDFDTNLFKDGKLAMWHTGIWMFDALADSSFEWDIAVEPGDAAPASAMFANAVVVSASSKQQEAAQAFATFLAGSQTSADTRIASGWELPPIADDAVRTDYLAKTPPTNRQAVFDALDAVILPPVIERQQEMQDAVTEELTEAAAGRKSPEEAVAAAAERVKKLL
jgi:multiple sugar transport system substrate-binding protein